MSHPALLLSGMALLATLLGGCAGNGPAAATDDGGSIEVTDTTAGVRGVVVDAGIVPMEGVTVKLNPGARETTTDKAGTFRFEGLDPGTYFIRAVRPGFVDGQVTATAEAGVAEPEVLRIKLEADVDGRPFAQLYTWTGFLQCGVGLGVLGTYNPCWMTGSDNLHTYVFPRTPDFLQVEMVWVPSVEALSDELDAGFLKDGTIDNWAGASGASPLIFNVGKYQIQENEGAAADNVSLRVFPTAVPNYSVVVQQDFDVYATAFFGFKPYDRWTFLADGECDRPEVCGAGRG